MSTLAKRSHKFASIDRHCKPKVHPAPTRIAPISTRLPPNHAHRASRRLTLKRECYAQSPESNEQNHHSPYQRSDATEPSIEVRRARSSPARQHVPAASKPHPTASPARGRRTRRPRTRNQRLACGKAQSTPHRQTKNLPGHSTPPPSIQQPAKLTRVRFLKRTTFWGTQKSHDGSEARGFL